MSLILPSSVAPSQPGNTSSKASARNEEPEQNTAGSFSQALSRSLQPAQATEKPADKAAVPATAKRRASEQKTEPQDLLNTMMPPFAPLPSKMAEATASGDGTTAGKSVPGSAATLLTELMAGAAASTDTSSAATAVATGAFAQPAGKPESTPSALTAAALAPSTSGLALLAAGSENAGQASRPTQRNPETGPASDSAAITLDLEKTTRQAMAPTRGSGHEPAQRGDKAPPMPDPLTHASADPTPAAPPGRAKMASTAPAPTEAPQDASQAASQAVTQTLNQAADTSAAWSNAPVNATAQGPVNLADSIAPAPATRSSLTPEVGSREWGQALGQQVAHMSHAGQQVAELQLNPPGLGPLKVTVSMNDQQVQVLFASAHPSVRAAVEAALPQLRSNLADSGISLGNTSVSADSQQQAAFSQPQPQSQGGQGGQRSYRSDAMPNPQALASRAVTELPRRGNGISVDTYA